MGSSAKHTKISMGPVSMAIRRILTKNANKFRQETSEAIPIAYDLASHHALGAGSYVFKTGYPAYLKSLLPDPQQRTEINIMLQPNSSPHIGTLCNLNLAFVVARRLQDLGVSVIVRCDLEDEAKGEETTIDGTKYQRSLRSTGQFQKYLPDYEHILKLLAGKYKVNYRMRVEAELFEEPQMAEVIQGVINDRFSLGKYLMPSTGALAIRMACPECGLVDKYGVNNTYAQDGSNITFRCPTHGSFSCNVATETHKLQFNCQLLNLVMGRFYEKVDYNWIEIIGSDYAGFWQEQLLWRFLSKPAIIVYTPLITDWSGSKVSKSLYLKNSAYNYLERAGMDFLLSYAVFRKEGRSLDVLCQEIEKWVDEPYRLFRNYSLHYMYLMFQGIDMQLGIIHNAEQKRQDI